MLDSQADDEFEECLLKARFLTGLDPGFELFETMWARRQQGGLGAFRPLDLHMVRLALQRTGAGLSPSTKPQPVRRLPTHVAVLLNAQGAPSRLRLALSHDGRIAITHAPLAPLPAGEVGLLIADERLPNHNPLSPHKTTLRRHYGAGVQVAERAGAFDSLFFTRDGRLVEGGRTSVFVQVDGRLVDAAGEPMALRLGVMRAQPALGADTEWGAAERSLTLEDLHRAQAIVVCNALRGSCRRAAAFFALRGPTPDMDSDTLALFDLDHTLIPFDSGMAWTRFLILRGVLPATEAEERATWPT